MPRSKGNVDNKNSSKKEKISHEWKINWFDNANETQKENWKLGKPMFKYCKKRKEFFSEDFFDVWYKAPYKYHMLLKAKNLGDANVTASLDVTYEDGQKINSKEESISKTESTFVSSSDNQFEVKLGSFQFNVCSYKHDGRKFRLVVQLFVEGDEKPVCSMTSTGFVIKAKKPISKPGIKTKKRKRQEEAHVMEHQAKYMAIPYPMKQKFEMIQNPLQNVIKTEAPFYGLSYLNMQQPPQMQQPITGTFDVLENLRSTMEMDVVDAFPTTQLELDDCYQPFENPQQVYPQEQISHPVAKQVSESSLYRVDSVLSAFETMSEKERKQTICRLIEKCHEYEREFLNRKYFSVPSTPVMPQQFPMQPLPFFHDGMQTTNVAQYFT